MKKTHHVSLEQGRNITDARSAARGLTKSAIRTLKTVMENENANAMSRVAAAKAILDRGWGKCAETHHVDVNDGASLLKVVNEIVHVHETREQIEFTDQVPLLDLVPEDNNGNGSKSTH